MAARLAWRGRRRLAGLLAALCVTATALSQAPPPAGFPGVAPEGPEQRILRFSAAPGSLEAGEATTLSWEVINAFSVSITPDVGTVATRGSVAIEPAATTAYTLAVSGSGGTTQATVEVTVSGALSRVDSGPGTTVQAAGLPQLADGKPDLSGLYLGGRDIRMMGEVALVPGAEQFRVPVNDEDLGLGALCLPPGVPAATMVPYPLQIVHKENIAVILYEAYNPFRLIYIGADHPEDLDPTWMGHSIGRWDGDTLVVDVTGFNDKTRIANHRHTEAMQVTERYRRNAAGNIEYSATVEDPSVFAQPIEYAGELVAHPEWEIGEYICVENNKDYAELFSD